MPVTVAVGNLISEEGFSLMMPPAAAGSIWTALLGQGAVPMGSNAWETLRILRGNYLNISLFSLIILFFLKKREKGVKK